MAKLLSGPATRALWALVTAVGVLVVVLVLGLQLIPRLSAGQRVLDDAGPAFTNDRVEGHPGAIEIVSQITNLADPIATSRGTAAAEVPKLVAFVSDKAGLSEGQVLAALKREAPKTTSLLQSLPLSEVTKELPGLVAFLATTLKISEEEVSATLNRDFPRLAQTIKALPTVTNGWNNVPGTENWTRFDGDPVRSVPEVRDAFQQDVIPTVERQRDNLQGLQERGGVGFIPYLLLVVGLVVVAFGVLMLLRTRGGPLTRGAGMAAWGVVCAVGVVVVALVIGLSLFPRLGGGQELLDDAEPAFTDERVAGDRAGINMVSSIVDVADPIATFQGGASQEVPKLVGFVSRKTGLSDAAVLSALRKEAPRTTALLEAIPLSAITAEIPPLAAFLSSTLKISGDELIETLGKSFPGLAQVITNVGPVTTGWRDVPGTESLTRFDGERVQTVPDVRDYFSKDVVAAVEARKDDFQKLESTWPPVDVFPPLLLVIGIIVALLGALMVLASSRAPRAGTEAGPGRGAGPRPGAAAHDGPDDGTAPRGSRGLGPR